MRRWLFTGLPRAFLFSAIFHLLVATSFYFLPGVRPRKSVPAPARDQMIVDLQDVPKSAHLPQGSVTSKRSGKKRIGKSNKLSLKSLTPSFKPATGLLGADNANTDGDDEATEPAFDSPTGYGLNAKTYDKGNAIRGFLQAVHARINNALIFDSILAQYNHFGTVYLEFEIDRRGVLRLETLRANTDDRILKVHAVRSALVPALHRPLKENLWLKDRDSVRLRARFQFVRSRQETTLWDRNPEGISGYSLTFRRFTPERAVPRKLSEHLLNGGIDYDLFAMYEAWQKYNKANERRRLDVDPFAVYKTDPIY